MLRVKPNFRRLIIVTFGRKNDLLDFAFAPATTMTDEPTLEEVAARMKLDLGVDGRQPSGEVASAWPDVDEVVGDDTEADPALDAGQAFVAAAVQPMAKISITSMYLSTERKN
jgi:hypothetical protein